MCFAEGKNIVDVTMNYIVNDCMCDEAEASYMVSSFGLSMISSGVLSKPMLKRMGARLYYLLEPLDNCLVLFLGSRQTGIVGWSGDYVLLPGKASRGPGSLYHTCHGKKCWLRKR